MPTRNVVLTDHQARLIEALVEAGRYQNASEVLREGLRLVERRADEDEARLVALRRASEAGWRDLDEGRHADVAEDGLADFVGELGRQAADRARSAG